MKFTLEWLRQHLEFEVSLEQLCHAMTQQGLEVEEIDDRASMLKDFVIAEVIACEQHPNADKLRLCKVHDGKQNYQVVCGAPNAILGMKGVFAPVGTYVPGADFTIKQSKIRGELSEGMLCSERELQLSDEHDGIIALQDDAPIGENYAAWAQLDDVVIEIAITPNRGDCLGVRGIARDLAAAGLGTLKPLPDNDINDSTLTTHPNSIGWKIDLAADKSHFCPHVVGRYFSNVDNQVQTPLWMQRRLRAIGVKLISPLVDVTNYLTFDLARPLHVFDADKLSGDLVMRMGKTGEKLVALDDNEYACNEEMLVIADDKKLVSLAGVMGGADTGCSAETKNVFLEAALFDAINVAQTGRQLNIHSDARFRFERQVDSDAVISGIDYASQLILQICGGTAYQSVSAGANPTKQRQIMFDPAKLKTFGGVDMPVEKAIEILQALGFEITSNNNDKIQVVIPTFRPDIEHEACLIEEILRIYGYDNIPVVSLPAGKAVAGDILTVTQKRVNFLRRALCARGANEAYSWSFCDSRKAKRFCDYDEATAVSLTLQNPISSNLDMMRPSPLASLLEAVAENHAHKIFDFGLFEIGPAFYAVKDGQRLVASIIRSGLLTLKDWQQAGNQSNLYDIKADIESALLSIGLDVTKMKITKQAGSAYHPGRAGSYMLGKQLIANFGEIHPLTAKDYGLKKTISMGEIFIDNLPVSAKSVKARAKLSILQQQPVMRDFAFVLDRNIDAAELVRAIQKSQKEYVTDIRIFDYYQDDNLGDNKKSLALTVIFQPEAESFTDAQLDMMSNNIIQAAKNIGASLR